MVINFGEKAGKVYKEASIKMEGKFYIRTDKLLLDVEMIWDYLCNKSYWAAGRSKEAVVKSIENSICFGVFDSDDKQVGFARVISDCVIFAWILDVFILPEYRGEGLGKLLINEIINYKDLQGVKRWGLGTRDAHKLYEKFGVEHSKAQTNAIIKWVGNSQQRFDDLFHLFLTAEYRVVQRAAWPLSYCVIEHPQLIEKHFKELLTNLHTPKLSDAVKRNTLRLLQHIEIPERFHGDVMNICFDYIASPLEAAAVKAFTLTILQNLAQYYPEIKDEVKIIIEDRWEVESPAFRSRAKKFLAL